MKILLFGADGRLGEDVLRTCLDAPDVTRVTAVLRAPTGRTHAKLHALIHHDFFTFEPIAAELADHDACFYCLGITPASVSERDYRRITHDLTLAAAGTLAAVAPHTTFIYVSAADADADDSDREMTARIKGETETAVLRLPLRAPYVLRPGVLQPSPARRAPSRGFFTAIQGFFRRPVTAAEIGRAMLSIARRGFAKRVLATRDIRTAARAQP